MYIIHMYMHKRYIKLHSLFYQFFFHFHILTKKAFKSNAFFSIQLNIKLFQDQAVDKDKTSLSIHS